MNSVISYLFKNQFVAGILFLLIGWLLFQIKGIILALFIAYIIMAGLHPFVQFLRSNRFPKTLSVIIPYITTLALIVLLVVPLVPFFVAQITALFNSFPEYFDRAANLLGIDLAPAQTQKLLTDEFGSIGRNAVALTARVFGGIFSLLTIFVVSFYLMLDHDNIKRNIIRAFAKKDQEKAEDTLTKINEKLGGWLRGQIVLSVVVGFVTWLVLSLLSVPFALPLALIAGILEIIPTLGPIIASVPAIIVALNVSPNLALIVAISYIVINQIENSVLVPRIMQKAVGLHPLIIIVGVIIGGNLLGIAGALLSIPFVSLLVVIFKSLQRD